MKLNVLDRLLLLNMLPAEGSYTNLKLVREVREGLSFTEEEHGHLNFKTENEQIKWNDFITTNKATGEKLEGDPEFIVKMVAKNPDNFETKQAVGEKEIKIGEVAKGLIVKELKKLDKEEKLQENHMPLYGKFIEDEKAVKE